MRQPMGPTKQNRISLSVLIGGTFGGWPLADACPLSECILYQVERSVSLCGGPSGWSGSRSDPAPWADAGIPCRKNLVGGMSDEVEIMERKAPSRWHKQAMKHIFRIEW